MIFQSALTERIIIVAISQTWPIIYNSLFAYKLLKRAKNRSTITISSLFLMMATALTFAIFSIITVNSPFSYAFYVTSWYLLMLSNCFLVLFSWLLLHIGESISFIKYLIFIVLLSIIVSYVIWIGILYNGIHYNISTGWRPVFSLPFAISNLIYLIFILVIPEVIIAFKLLKNFKGVKIAIRIKLFLISSFAEYILMILLVIYNTLPENNPYRLIHLFIAAPLGLFAAYFIYRSFGKKID